MKRITFFAIIIILLGFSVNLVKSIYDIWSKRDILARTQSELTQAKKENSSLQKELSNVKSPSFLEEEARNKLFLVKPGESEVAIPTNLLIKPAEEKIKTKPLPIWQQWLNLFL